MVRVEEKVLKIWREQVCTGSEGGPWRIGNVKGLGRECQQTHIMRMVWEEVEGISGWD